MDRREQMRTWLDRRERLGMTLRELSEETGVPVGTLGHWAWKLRQEGRGPRSPCPTSSSFVEIVANSSTESSLAMSRIEVVLASGRRLVVPDGIDEEHLSRVVRVLERC